MSKPKIAILITNFEGGGAQKIALTQARALQDRGIEVQLIVLEHLDSYTIPEDLSVTLLTKGSGHDSKLVKLVQFPTLPFRLARFLRKHHISLCISHLERADFVNILAKPLARHKTISVIHSHLSANYFQEGKTIRSIVYMALVKALERFSDRITPVSQGIAHNLIKLGLPADKIQVIYNPFFISEIQHKATQNLDLYDQLFQQKKFILSIGRLSRQKGFWHSLKAFSQLRKNNPEYIYIILGDGPLRDYHVEVCAKLGLRTYTPWTNQTLGDSYDVYFLGFVDNPFRFLARAQCFVLPSHYEGLPNVIIEALICQAPIIATDSDSGPRELLAPETDLDFKTLNLEQAEYGMLVPVADPAFETDEVSTLTQPEQELLHAMTSLAKTPNLQQVYRDKALSRVTDFQVEAIIPQWEQLIKTLTQREDR